MVRQERPFFPETGKTYAFALEPAHLDGDAKIWAKIIWDAMIGLVIAGLWGGIRKVKPSLRVLFFWILLL